MKERILEEVRYGRKVYLKDILQSVQGIEDYNNGMVYEGFISDQKTGLKPFFQFSTGFNPFLCIISAPF